LAPIALLLLRAVQGLPAGGDLGVAAIFLLEHASGAERGRTAAWHTATIGIGAGMAVVAVLSHLFEGSSYGSDWWRIAFLIAIPLGVIGLLLRRRLLVTALALGFAAFAAVP
jgi:MFS transporter, MHS family, proline/betaine transporter